MKAVSYWIQCKVDFWLILLWTSTVLKKSWWTCSRISQALFFSEPSVIVFPLYFINALTLGSAFFIFWCQFLCIDIFMCYLFKMCVLKTNRSVKNIPGLEPHYHKILICRQTRNDIMEKNHWVQPDNLFWKVPFCFFSFFSFGGK